MQLPSSVSGASQPAGQRHAHETGSTTLGDEQPDTLQRHWHVTGSRDWPNGHFWPVAGSASGQVQAHAPPVPVCTWCGGEKKDEEGWRTRPASPHGLGGWAGGRTLYGGQSGQERHPHEPSGM